MRFSFFFLQPGGALPWQRPCRDTAEQTARSRGPSLLPRCTCPSEGNISKRTGVAESSFQGEKCGQEFTGIGYASLVGVTFNSTGIVNWEMNVTGICVPRTEFQSCPKTFPHFE